MMAPQWRVRPYQPGDETTLVDLWNAALPADPLDADTLAARVLADPNFRSSGLLVAERVHGPVPGEGPGPRPLLGFVLALSRRVPLDPGEGLEPECAWVTAFGVHPAVRRRGLGRALLGAACDELARRGAERVDVSPYAPGYFWPGVDREAYPEAAAFLEALGFHPLGEAVAMERSLIGYRPPAEVPGARQRLLGEGVRFRAFGPELVVPAVEWSRRVFHADWARSLRSSVASRLPWSRTRLALDATGAILGFAQFGCYDRCADRFGPFGVDPAARGRGIGKVLLHDTLCSMQREALASAWFLWTDENSPAGHLYRKAGFRMVRRFVLLRRHLGRAASVG